MCCIVCEWLVDGPRYSETVVRGAQGMGTPKNNMSVVFKILVLSLLQYFTVFYLYFSYFCFRNKTNFMIERKIITGIFWVLFLMQWLCVLIAGYGLFERSRILIIGFLICSHSIFRTRSSILKYLTTEVVQEMTGNRKVRRLKNQIWDRIKRKKRY